MVHQLFGMDGFVATIEGAYDTTVYAVTYTPKKVEKHKWVTEEGYQLLCITGTSETSQT